MTDLLEVLDKGGTLAFAALIYLELRAVRPILEKLSNYTVSIHRKVSNGMDDDPTFSERGH